MTWLNDPIIGIELWIISGSLALLIILILLKQQDRRHKKAGEPAEPPFTAKEAAHWTILCVLGGAFSLTLVVVALIVISVSWLNDIAARRWAR